MQNFLGIYLAEIGNFLKRVYPPFVTAVRPASPGEGVPVFVFHRVRDKQFSEQLEFLAKNNYRTLTADELFDFVLKGKKTPEKSIVLTFDDGERSLYTVAFPLLKKFGFKATSFIVPSFISEGQDYKQSGKQWLSWSEVNEMERSGFIDFQSHTLEHEKMFINDEIVDFYHPNLFVDELGLDVPTVLSNENYCKLAGFGAPVYRMGSRMDSSLRYFDDERLRMDCIEHVENHGGVSFLKQRGWRQKIDRLFRKLQEDR
ncbi:polysaccharide deacetylase family protein, partial [candidate division WOR-3 bacterium]|nr:polysaccharide deacetylase family protein [candidate division WOR-3 bacterium]